MNCVEFEQVLPDYLEGDDTPERQAHLNSCRMCSGLVSDLNSISSQAPLLQEFEEPSPRVWNALEAQLRREGLIRTPASSSPALAEFFRRWRGAWLVPVAAALVLAAGLKLYHPARAGDNTSVAKQVAAPASKPAVPAASAEDRDLLSTVASRPPAQQASYRQGLDQANNFIRDAEQSVRNDPNDVYMQRLLMNAYEQKQMLYDLAVDRSTEEQ